MECWCIGLPDGGELQVRANALQIVSGTLILARRDRGDADEVAMTLAPGAWTTLRADLTAAGFEQAIAEGKFCLADGPAWHRASLERGESQPIQQIGLGQDEPVAEGRRRRAAVVAFGSLRRWLPWRRADSDRQAA
jgi:hypothetical protein